MSKKEQLYFSLEKIIEGRPSILRNSTLVLFFRIFSWVLMITSFVLALFYKEVFDFAGPVVKSPPWESIPWVRVSFIFSFVVFWLMLRLTKMIHRRNSYLLDIELWMEEYKAEARKDS